MRLVSFVCEKSSQCVMPLSRPEGVARVNLQKTAGRDCRGPKLIVRVWTETMVESRRARGVNDVFTASLQAMPMLWGFHTALS